jgi:hypothetical protein
MKMLILSVFASLFKFLLLESDYGKGCIRQLLKFKHISFDT